jgi:hypothetical protein
MRTGAIVAGVLGAGCALVFALAIAASAMFPNGGSISSSFNQAFGGGMMPTRAVAQPFFAPTPAVTQDLAPNAGGGSDAASPPN